MENYFKTPSIFISYSSHDFIASKYLYENLRREGFKCFFDKKDVSYGKYFNNEIKDKLRSTNCMVACITSESYYKDGYVKKEWRIGNCFNRKQQSANYVFIPLVMEKKIEAEIINKKLLFSNLNLFPYYEKSSDENLICELKKRFKIPIITDMTESQSSPWAKKYNIQIDMEFLTMDIRSWFVFDTVRINRILEKVRPNAFYFEKKIPLELKGSQFNCKIEIRISYRKWTSFIKKVEIYYNDIKLLFN